MAPTTPHRRSDSRIDDVQATAYKIPTDHPEADGTLAWSSTTLVIATITCGGHTGLGYTYAHSAAAAVIAAPLRKCLIGADPMDIPALWQAMNRSLRNIGRPGVGLMAISAVDHALWDLKARLLGISVTQLLGGLREKIPAYGSGGFTSYDVPVLSRQLHQFIEQGFTNVKMKVGTTAAEDPYRVGEARKAIGNKARLMVDANGAYTAKQALAMMDAFATLDVVWFEEPVSSDDLPGLAQIRARAPHGMSITAGEYGWDVDYFKRMLAAGAVDVVQIDSTRCGGFTGFLRAAALARSFRVPVSAHCSPHLHAHVCTTIEDLQHVEYFHDHARIERMFFDGLPALEHGQFRIDRRQPGLGLTLKEKDAERYRVAT